MGIILGVANQAGWLDKNGDMPGIEKCFKVDSLSTVAGSFFLYAGYDHIPGILPAVWRTAEEPA